jgi:hypothetical protein
LLEWFNEKLKRIGRFLHLRICPVYDGGDDVISGVEEVNCVKGFVRGKRIMESPDLPGLYKIFERSQDIRKKWGFSCWG